MSSDKSFSRTIWIILYLLWLVLYSNLLFFWFHSRSLCPDSFFFLSRLPFTYFPLNYIGLLIRLICAIVSFLCHFSVLTESLSLSLFLNSKRRPRHRVPDQPSTHTHTHTHTGEDGGVYSGGGKDVCGAAREVERGKQYSLMGFESLLQQCKDYHNSCTHPCSHDPYE